MELQELLQYWEQIKGWVIGLGTTGVLALAFNIGLKLRSNSHVKKVLGVYTTFQREQVKVNEKVLGVVSAVVSDYKEIKNDVKEVLDVVKHSAIETNKQVEALMEINALLISLLPMSAEVKLEVAKKLKLVKDNYISTELLEIVKKSNTHDELNDILED